MELLNKYLSSKRYEPQPIDLANLNNSHTLCISLVGFHKKVLEIGTSTGYVSKILQDHENIVTGIEVDGEAGSIARSYCEQIIIGDVETIDLDSVLKNSLYDVVLCGDILEHLKDPVSLLTKIIKFLKPDGYLVVSLPNFCHGDVLLNLLHGDFRYSPLGLLDETHLRFFGLKNIYHLFAESGYQISDIHTTNIEVGGTELKIDHEKIPGDLLRFIQSLPQSTVYQYVFTAHPAETVTIPLMDEVDIKKIFSESLVETRQPLLHELDIQTKRAESLQQDLDLIRNSIVWQTTMKFHTKVMVKLFPENSRRSHYYNLGRAGGKILLNNGFSAFYVFFVQYMKKGNSRDDYHEWIEKNEPTPHNLDRLKEEIPNFSYHPKISIITPVWNIDEKWLRLSIESVMNQIYENWELCLVDGGSSKKHIRKVMTEYAKKDLRIKIKFLEENQGIAGNSNEALSLATGDYIGFLDHDDELAPFALFEAVKVLNTNQKYLFIYSDEDKMNEKGVRKDPFFKPDWSPDLFYTCNYLCHFSIIRAQKLHDIGGFRMGYDGSQDYDLFLRITESLNQDEIFHIPKILYHWRMLPQSASSSTEAKPFAYIAAGKALISALSRRGIRGDVTDGLVPGTHRVRYPVQNNPKVSIIIPTKDSVEILQRCVQSILDKTVYKNYDIVIVDNQSVEKKTFDYFETLRNNPKFKLLQYNKSFNFSAINNYAVTRIDSPYILFLNNDTEVIADEWLTAMLEYAQQENVGAVGAKLLYPDNTIQHAGIIIGIIGDPAIGGHSHRHIPDGYPGYFGRASLVQNVSAVTAACMLTKKDVFNQVGGFNEDLAIAFNDVDLCLKIREKGFLIVYTPYAKLYHHESLSRGSEDTLEKRKRFKKEVKYVRERWASVYTRGDPYYNPNLTRDKEDFSIKK
jgi:GT2 family glycosyltransferase/2-polyprenyl-3-methyl-5-hydroxy-6-metoxy-1,4-benzoquinol methylase